LHQYCGSENYEGADNRAWFIRSFASEKECPSRRVIDVKKKAICAGRSRKFGLRQQIKPNELNLELRCLDLEQPVESQNRNQVINNMDPEEPKTMKPAKEKRGD